MILHVAGLDKFIPPFVEFVNQEFSSEEHKFWITADKGKFQLGEHTNVYLAKNTLIGKLRAYALLLINMHRSEKVLLHGLFNNHIVMILAFCPWLLPRCYWIIWGGDLYHYQKPKTSTNAKFRELCRAFVIRRIGHLVTYITGDVGLARRWYGASGAYHECLMYLSNVFDPTTVAKYYKDSKKRALHILVGNSADPSNNHIDALARLLPYTDQDIKIFVPLSYGNQTHAQEVIYQGREWFGEKFVALTSFMPFDQYLDFLNSLDIAIFNHRRQQAMGNTITLLGLGKTVYLRKDVSQWRFLSDLGLQIHDVESFSPSMLHFNDSQRNISIVAEAFSKERLIRQYTEIFRE